jgi:hypothetical protein
MGVNRLAVIVAWIAAALLSAPSQAADSASQPSSQTVPSADTGTSQPTAPLTLPPATPSRPAPVETSPPPSVTVIDAVEAHGILGRDIRSPANENMGRIVDVIVDRSGKPRAALIDFGGFLGVGSRKIVVDWSALHFWNVANKAESITLELTRDQVKAAPEYKEDKPMVVLGASGNLAPMRFIP